MSDELFESLTKQGKEKKGVYLFFNKTLLKTRIVFKFIGFVFNIFKYKILIILYHFLAFYSIYKLIKNI